MPVVDICPRCPKGTRPRILLGNGCCPEHQAIESKEEVVKRIAAALESFEDIKISGKKPIKQKKPIKKVSDKRKGQLKEYNAKVKAILKERPLCEMRIPEAKCTLVATEFHHPEGRDNDKIHKDGIVGCHNCHMWITEHSKEAIEMGLSKPRVTLIKRNNFKK